MDDSLLQFIDVISLSSPFMRLESGFSWLVILEKEGWVYCGRIRITNPICFLFDFGSNSGRICFLFIFLLLLSVLWFGSQGFLLSLEAMASVLVVCS